MSKTERKIFWSGFAFLAIAMALVVLQSVLRYEPCASDAECQEYCYKMQWDNCELNY